MANLETIEGIGETYAAKLNEVGVTSVEDLLEKGRTRGGRQDIAQASGISDTLILKWVNHADLMRIKGVGSEYSELLEAAGVDSVVELATRNAANLHAKMVEVNEARKLVRNLPSAGQVSDWVSQAKGLPRAVEH